MKHEDGADARSAVCLTCQQHSWTLSTEAHNDLTHRGDTHLYSAMLRGGVTDDTALCGERRLLWNGKPDCGLCGGVGEIFGAACQCTLPDPNAMDWSNVIDCRPFGWRPEDWYTNGYDDLTYRTLLTSYQRFGSGGIECGSALYEILVEVDKKRREQEETEKASAAGSLAPDPEPDASDDLPVSPAPTVVPLVTTPGQPVGNLLDEMPVAIGSTDYAAVSVAGNLPTLKCSKTSSTAEVAAFCNGIQIPAAIVGTWIWIQFDAKPLKTTTALLKAAGFFYNIKRKMWQHKAGQIKHGRSKKDNKSLIAQFGGAHDTKED